MQYAHLGCGVRLVEILSRLSVQWSVEGQFQVAKGESV